MPDDNALLTATELVAGYSSGELSPVDATAAALHRIEADNAELNCYCLVDSEMAMAQAKTSAERWDQGNPIGLLDGVPSSIKDMFLTEGWPTLRGSKCIDPNQPWDVDSPVTFSPDSRHLVLAGEGFNGGGYPLGPIVVLFAGHGRVARPR